MIILKPQSSICLVLLHSLSIGNPFPPPMLGWGPGAVVKTACLGSRRSRVRAPLWPSSLQKTKCFFPAHSYRLNIVGSLRDRGVACSASHFESRVWRAVSSQSSPHPQEARLGQFNLHVHKGGLKSHSFHCFTPMLRDRVNCSLDHQVNVSF